MKTANAILLSAACAALMSLNMPARAVTMVLGNKLAHDCYLLARAGGQATIGIRTCNSALENEALSPHDRAGTYVNRGALKMEQKQVDDAILDYNTGIAIFPLLGDAYVDRGGALTMKDKFDEAMIDINRGIELGPSQPFAGYYNRAVTYQRMGKYKEAYLDYKKTLELESRFEPAAERLKDFVVVRKPAANAP